MNGRRWSVGDVATFTPDEGSLNPEAYAEAARCAGVVWVTGIGGNNVTVETADGIETVAMPWELS